MIKCKACQASNLSIFPNNSKFNKFNNTQECQTIYRVIVFKLFCDHVFWCENVKLLPNICDVIMGINTWCYLTPTARVSRKMDFTYLKKGLFLFRKGYGGRSVKKRHGTTRK